MTKQFRLFEDAQGSNPRLNLEALTRFRGRGALRKPNSFNCYWQKLKFSKAATLRNHRIPRASPKAPSSAFNQLFQRTLINWSWRTLVDHQRSSCTAALIRNLPLTSVGSQLKPQCKLLKKNSQARHKVLPKLRWRFSSQAATFQVCSQRICRDTEGFALYVCTHN